MQTPGKNKQPIEISGRYELRLPIDLLKAIDVWRRNQSDYPTKAGAIRRLCQLGLQYSRLVDSHPAGPETVSKG